MPSRWTTYLRCFKCECEFILNRVSIAEAYTVPRVVPCPYCGAKADSGGGVGPHKVIFLRATTVPYRRGGDGDAWHYSEYCSAWPKENFVEIDMVPSGEMCNECRALESEHSSG